MRMKELLVLSLGLLALVEANRTPLQQKALDMVLDDFHSRAMVQSAFREQAVSEVIEVVLQGGTFVQMEVELVQTFCRNHQRKTHSCRIRPSGKKQRCLACFKFDFSSPENVMDKSSRCLAEQSPIFQEVKRRQSQECESVKNANEELYRPGQFAFSRGLPP